MFVMSAMVSVPVENVGGLLAQPMGRTSGTAIMGSGPGFVRNTTPSLGALPGFKFTWWNPSLQIHLDQEDRVVCWVGQDNLL